MSGEEMLGLMIIAVAPAIRDDIGPGQIAQSWVFDPSVVEKQAEFYLKSGLAPDYVLNQGQKLGSYQTYRAILFATKGVVR